MGLMDAFKKKKKEVGTLDDVSYIAEMTHVPGQWHQYDFQLASQGYDWDYIIDAAEYMTKSELKRIGTVSVGFEAGEAETELIDEYNISRGSVKKMKSLSKEGANLGIGGMSKIIGAPTKIGWFNQTNTIRIFTPVDDEDLLTRYAETMIRITFGTPDAMKRAKPVE